MSLAGRMFRTVSAAIPPGLARLTGRPAALFFHGVEREIQDADLQSNHHALDDFVRIVEALKRHFDVAPLAELSRVLNRPERYRRTVFLMADDGYANNLTIAAEVLADAGLPWTLFVSTEHIDTGALNPMFVARAFLKFAPSGRYRVPGFPGELRLTLDRDVAASRCLAALKRMPAATAREAVGTMHEVLRGASTADTLDRFTSDKFLTWDGVRALAARGVIIGAHAHFHWPLHAGESAEYLRLQAAMPKRRIEAEVGPCRYFAYPFGNVEDVSSAGWRAVRDAGYEYGFTTIGGALNGGGNPWLLPRYGLAPDEGNLGGLVPMLRLGNGRLSRWQAELA